ncbi:MULTISPECIES: hypothetical protein [Salinivibrio]|uniref:Uncharacterized protein n=1 Tax=Salinivibrio costicola TaxID=51367 RepID=A0ABX6K895_SALCS|nr:MULTISPECIES: hypothetical protein [Salinivibrio]QIR07751.1 hypothetical protein HBA18_15235 [Salinivibrio costicola]
MFSLQAIRVRIGMIRLGIVNDDYSLAGEEIETKTARYHCVPCKVSYQLWTD